MGYRFLQMPWLVLALCWSCSTNRAHGPGRESLESGERWGEEWMDRLVPFCTDGTTEERGREGSSEEGRSEDEKEHRCMHG